MTSRKALIRPVRDDCRSCYIVGELATSNLCELLARIFFDALPNCVESDHPMSSVDKCHSRPLAVLVPLARWLVRSGLHLCRELNRELRQLTIRQVPTV